MNGKTIFTDLLPLGIFPPSHQISKIERTDSYVQCVPGDCLDSHRSYILYPAPAYFKFHGLGISTKYLEIQKLENHNTELNCPQEAGTGKGLHCGTFL